MTHRVPIWNVDCWALQSNDEHFLEGGQRVWRRRIKSVVYDLAGEKELDLGALRARLRRMSDRDLLRFGRAARYMCSPVANHG